MKKNRQMKNQKRFENEEFEQKIEGNKADDAAQNEAFEALKQENQKLKDELLRTLADSENIKKRCAVEMEKTSKYAVSSFAKDLLGVADNLDRALGAVQASNGADCQALLEGVKLTRQELSHVFEKFGITKMDIIGKPFDPNFHQVIQQISDPSKPAGTVVEQLQTGYMINGRILREAMVVVSKE